MESEELITLIEQAFPSHPVPKITFRQRTLSDQGMSRDISEEEWENVGRVDRDVPWTSFSDDDLLACKEGISHLAVAEFAYYLGALLRFAVRHLNASTLTPEGSLVSSIMFHLTDRPEERVRDYVHSRWEALDHVQTGVVRRFLKHVASHSGPYGHDANQALFYYWARAKQPN